jgi:hypothetical protein
MMHVTSECDVSLVGGCSKSTSVVMHQPPLLLMLLLVLFNRSSLARAQTRSSANEEEEYTRRYSLSGDKSGVASWADAAAALNANLEFAA